MSIYVSKIIFNERNERKKTKQACLFGSASFDVDRNNNNNTDQTAYISYIHCFSFISVCFASFAFLPINITHLYRKKNYNLEIICSYWYFGFGVFHLMVCLAYEIFRSQDLALYLLFRFHAHTINVTLFSARSQMIHLMSITN